MGVLILRICGHGWPRSSETYVTKPGLAPLTSVCSIPGNLYGEKSLLASVCVTFIMVVKEMQREPRRRQYTKKEEDKK